MLPGFRFLFAAIVLSLSTLVFGLGAAALLHASHERFASLPALPIAPALPPSVATGDATPRETPPTLALLRVETPEIEAAATPRAVPEPVTDHATPASPSAQENRQQAVAPETSSPPQPEPTLPAATATMPDEPAKVDEAASTIEAPAPEMAAPPTATPTPASVLSEAAPAASIATPTEVESVETTEQQPTDMSPPQVETAAPAEPVMQTEPIQPEPAKVEQAQSVQPEPPETESVAANALAVPPVVEPRPEPLAAPDAPVKTAMLASPEPAPSAIPDPAVAITGPIPLPRAREWALAQHRQAAQRAAHARKLAAARARARTRPAARQSRPAAQAPAATPNPFFPFGQ